MVSCGGGCLALGHALNSSSAPRPFGTAYLPISLSEVEQEYGASNNRHREAIVMGAGLSNGEGERAFTLFDSILD